jgi:biopolymer transport protein ExbB
MSEVLELIRQGGWVMLPIVAATAAAWALIAWEWFALRDCTGAEWTLVRQGIDHLARQGAVAAPLASHPPRNIVRRILESGALRYDIDRQGFESQVMPLLRSESLIRWRLLHVVGLLTIALPLLGLLGTVTGMMATFSVLTERGATHANALADGISQALLTTQAGLVSAVPILLMHGVLAARVRRYLDTAELLVGRIATIVCEDSP